MDFSTIIALINLLNVPKIGPKRVRTLLTDHQDIHSIFQLPEMELCKTDGIDLRLSKEIKQYSEFSFGQMEFDRAEKEGIRIISILDKDYPLLLKNIDNPPVLLYTKGQPLRSKDDSVAIVGSRMTTDYGKIVAESIAKDITSYGLTVVSGLARGIDTIAHKTVLKESGKTIAVLGSGLDIIYPSENKYLVDGILEKGTIISEFPLGTGPEPGNFPQRNRIISGLCHGTTVVEAGNKSGAILTALNAIDQNREVFAVPGRIYDKQSVGCLRLIKHGAVPILDGHQIIDHIKNKLFIPLKHEQSKIILELNRDESKVMEHIGSEPIHIDSLRNTTSIKLTELLTILLQLELKGVVKQIGGKQFVRCV